MTKEQRAELIRDRKDVLHNLTQKRADLDNKIKAVQHVINGLEAANVEASA